MFELAIANALRDLVIGIVGVGTLAGLLWLEIRSGRRHKERVEREDLADFETARSSDWEFPPKWRPPAEEYVVGTKERVR